MFKRYFPNTEHMENATERLSMLEALTPGDYKAVFSRIRFNPVHEAEAIVAELELECAYRKQGRRIGFNAG